MRSPPLAPLLMMALLPLAAALPPPVATYGPHAGVVIQGFTNVHHHEGDIPGFVCAGWQVEYTVTLRYEPAGDELTLEVVGFGSDDGSGGHAEVAFEAGECADLTFEVTGTSVQSVAAYSIGIERTPPA